MASACASSFFQFLSITLLLVTLSSMLSTTLASGISIKEATVQDLQLAFQRKQLTSRQLVEFYLKQINIQNPVLKGVLEVNPDALAQADRADKERREKAAGSLSRLHGIPILVKDNIATKDKLNTTAGSFALLGSVVPRDAGVVNKLRKAGAIILGKATLSEWSHYRSNGAPSGWSARGGQGKNPYTLDDPCGSSSGPAISVAANLVAVSLGTETDGSILCPSCMNSVVGIKPTVGLTSRAGVVPISPRQDTVGPICRTVSDAAYVLETIAGIDPFDKATIEASKYIPKGGYAQFLKKDGLRGKRLGVVRLYYEFGNDTLLDKTFKLHLNTLRRRGAVLIDNLKIDNIVEIFTDQSEQIALNFEFKLSLNKYLKELVASPVKSLADVIAFNKKHPKSEKLEYGQDLMVQAEKTNGIGKAEKQALLNMTRSSQNGFEKLMKRNKLDAVVIPLASFSNILAIGGYPGVIVPAGYEKDQPFGICFGGLKGSDPKLIEIAYSFEQATLIRKPPPLRKLEV
ncbi:putative asparaginyl-tRNA synthase (glutamine-hydrolyzing) [Medicago truncatula]|uniref:Amidase C869.01-like protein, putative n=1 Tax=Medicago truncatula TaxID=3880 RepID=A0A072U458_MEDTR|nr:probable amidase At4g34880 [Medicago truncatula]KEH20625.1 amidase C869.01-like protein, putative [Medicago truncatula]RHN42514.1 putative asparaginyl-tRNA synthase (glutamine-hydrolyzing) [Medicago truncatula]